MNRSFHKFPCKGQQLAATLDQGDVSTGLLIVSGGNEIRSGAHSGMAQLAARLSRQGFPVFRYDRRGIGESSGDNNGFLSSAADIEAAASGFQTLCPNIKKLVAFGNCDAATALALFGTTVGINEMVLANPWVIDETETDSSETTNPPPSAIRARYWERLKNPRTIIDLVKGQIDFGKLLKGLRQATQKQENTGLSIQLRDAMQEMEAPCRVLLAKQDTTARAFLAAWNSAHFDLVRKKTNIDVQSIDSASHSFADRQSKDWLESQILEVLETI